GGGVGGCCSGAGCGAGAGAGVGVVGWGSGCGAGWGGGGCCETGVGGCCARTAEAARITTSGENRRNTCMSLMLLDSTYGKLRGLKRLPKIVWPRLAHHL